MSSSTVTVQADNDKPTAEAGEDISVHPDDSVTLGGSSSSDPEEQPLSYAWRQDSGTIVTLSSTTVESPTFTAPELPMDETSEELVFELIVNDGMNNSDPDTVTVTIGKTPPPTPGAITGPDSSINGSYSLSWSSSSGAESYQLQEEVNGGIWSTVYTGASITESFSDKGSRNFGSSTTDYGYRVRACNGVACSAWMATKTVTVTLAATTGFDSSFLVRSGNLGPDTDTDLYISPLAVASGNVGEFILRNVGGTFTLESTPSTTDLVAAQQWTPSTQFEVRVEDINLDGTADAYVKGISGTISNAVDQIIVSSTTAGAAPVSIVSVDSDFKNFFTPIMAWYANPSHFDTRIIIEGAWVLATATDIPALYTIAESTCIARWGNCRSRDGTLTSYYGSETDCVFALLAMGLTPTDIAGNPISRTVFCNRTVKAYFGVVVTTRTVRSFAGQLQKMAEFVTIWEAGEDRYGVEDLADVLEAVVGVTIGGYDFSHVENDDLDEADEQRVYEVHQALLNIWALLGERGRDRTNGYRLRDETARGRLGVARTSLELACGTRIHISDLPGPQSHHCGVQRRWD